MVAGGHDVAEEERRSSGTSSGMLSRLLSAEGHSNELALPSGVASGEVGIPKQSG